MPRNYSGQTLHGRYFKAGDDLQNADFNNARLRGVDFKGCNLAGAIFNNAQIQGAIFSHANLCGANFTRAKAGLQYRSTVWSLIIMLCLSAASGFISAYVGYTIGPQFQSGETNKLIAATASLLVVFVFFILSTRTNLGITLWIGFFVLALINSPVSLVTGISVTAAGALVGSIIGAFVIVSTVFITESNGSHLQFIIISIINNLLASLTALFISYFRIQNFPDLKIPESKTLSTLYGACSLTSIAMILSIYIAWKTIAGDKKYSFIFQVALAFSSRNGTSFEKANLTNANFSESTLKCTNFKDSIITKTCWSNAKKLNLARTKGTILIEADVRDLLVTGKGKNCSYIGQNLKGANLENADLSGADLTEADISGATLASADLTDANLTKTQALGAIFREATLTGTCLEAWNIDNSTQLEGAKCEYIYLLSNKQEKRPSSGTFASGEFAKLFQEVLSTIDLIFRDGLDWKAFVIAFKELQVENEDLVLSIQSIENKGDDVMVVRVNAPPEANKGKLYSTFIQNYEAKLKVLENEYRDKLQAKDEQIIAIYREKSADMKEIANFLAQRSITVELNNSSESKSMNNSTDSSHKIEIGNVGGDFNASGSALNLGDISGTVTNSLNQLQSAKHPNASELAALLNQLQTAITTDTDLSPDDQAEALEQVNTLAQAGQNPQDTPLKKEANKAVKLLRGVIAVIPSTATLVKACSELLPAIMKLLGL